MERLTIGRLAERGGGRVKRAIGRSRCRYIMAALVIATIGLGATVEAQAGGRHHGYHGYRGHQGPHYGHYRRHHFRGHHRHGGDVVLGVIAGVGLAGVLLAPPRYAVPAPVYYQPYYAPPPSRQCVQEDVYRYLPDGRVQWGVKTTCY